ncbi:BamA/TamA family outer membrane protein [Novosphingobium sp.]|uniref:autotransporter assembly complex protein TamA n=1 Tax=Novosphingobium sp. TaxID=1874826 RepID=UPI002630D2DA|nr:BamA/TamA family outer membrane protein [Novosphingobium sp.]
MASTARRSVTPTFRATGQLPLARILAGLMALALPGHALAQTLDADQELEALIPDSAVQNADAWALDTEAARTVVPTAMAIDELSADVEMPELPGLTIPWPDGSEIAEITPLSPDPDIDVAEQSVDAAVEALPGQEQAEIEERLAKADIARIGKQVELAFPIGEEAIAEKDAIVARFAALSSLKAYDDDKDNLAQIVRRGRTDSELLVEILRVYGYYDASVFQSLGGLERVGEGEARGPIDIQKVAVRFDIQPGPQYKFGKLAFGDLEATGGDYAALRGAFKLNPGDAVNADRIVAERLNLQAALGESGYAFAKVAETDLLIDHERREGDLTVPVTPGGVYRFGKITSSREKFLSGKHLQRIAKFDPGEVYQRSDVDDLRQAVLATGLVSSVSVETREATPPANGEPGTVDVDVSLTPGPLRTLAGLVGYSSGEGFRVEASWEHRNFFPPEGMVRVRGVAGTQEQLLGLTFRRNNFLTRDLVLTADLYARQQRNTAFQARTVSFLGGLERLQTLLFQKPLIFAAGVEILATSERDAAAIAANAPRQTYFIGALPMRIAYDGSDDLLDPKRGFRVGLRASPEISVQDGARSSYGKLQFDASYYQPFGEKLVVAGRVRLGSILGTDITNIAPSRRFYAGGGGSVRGYGFQLIGPRDTAGEPSGGRSLSEFSLEARVKTGLMGGAISLVPFVDAGAVDITSTPRLRDIKVGAGIGLRYETNFGPIRIDLGTPINPSPGDSRIGVYVALGQAF